MGRFANPKDAVLGLSVGRSIEDCLPAAVLVSLALAGLPARFFSEKGLGHGTLRWFGRLAEQHRDMCSVFPREGSQGDYFCL